MSAKKKKKTTKKATKATKATKAAGEKLPDNVKLQIEMSMRTDQRSLAYLAAENEGLRKLVAEIAAELLALRIKHAILKKETRPGAMQFFAAVPETKDT